MRRAAASVTPCLCLPNAAKHRAPGRVGLPDAMQHCQTRCNTPLRTALSEAPMSELFTPEALSALLQVIMIDLVLAGDNAIVIGLAAAGLPKDQRNKAILIGIIAATVLRIVFAALTTQLLQIVGLLLAGGILLLWVCWKMWRELRAGHAEKEMEAEEALEDRDLDQDGLIRSEERRVGKECRSRWS